MKRLLVTQLLTCMLLVACDRLPEANAPRSASLARPTSILLASDNLDPNFNLEIILRPTGDGDGFGHVTFRQDNDAEKRIDLDTWVRDLAPNTAYRLQRAVDTTIDDQCTSTAWLTLGEGSVAKDIVTDDKGTSKEELFRILTSPQGATFDIHFRVVTTAGEPVLESDCYQFDVR